MASASGRLLLQDNIFVAILSVPNFTRRVLPRIINSQKWLGARPIPLYFLDCLFEALYAWNKSSIPSIAPRAIWFEISAQLLSNLTFPTMFSCFTFPISKPFCDVSVQVTIIFSLNLFRNIFWIVAFNTNVSTILLLNLCLRCSNISTIFDRITSPFSAVRPFIAPILITTDCLCL